MNNATERRIQIDGVTWIIGPESYGAPAPQIEASQRCFRAATPAEIATVDHHPLYVAAAASLAAARAERRTEQDARAAAERASAERARKVRADLLAEAEATGKRCYVRLGAAPESGRSFNSRDRVSEAGVSVYAAWILADKRVLIDLRGVDCFSALFIVSEERDVYRADGTPCGLGSDGEPVLSPVKLVRLRGHRVIEVIV